MLPLPSVKCKELYRKEVHLTSSLYFEKGLFLMGESAMTFRVFRKISLFLFYSCLASSYFCEAKDQIKFVTPQKMAILGGGSINLGEGAHPSFDHRPVSLMKTLKGETKAPSQEFVNDFLATIALKYPQEYKSPTFFWPSFESFGDAFTWVYHHFTLALSRLSTDFPRLSWAYQLALSLGVESENLLIAAQPFDDVADLTNQFFQIQKKNQGKPVDTFFVFLTGTDFCRSHPSLFLTKEAFGKKFLSFLDSVLEDQKKLGTHQRRQLVVLNYLGISQIFGSQEIRKKKVFLPGQKESYTCQEYFENPDGVLASQLGSLETDLESYSFTRIFPQDRRLFCPTLFSRENFAAESLSFSSSFDSQQRERELLELEEEQMSHMAGLLRAYRKEMESSLQLRQEEAHKNGLDLIFVGGVEDLEFAPKHMSNDCVNLSYLGHELIAKKVLDSLHSGTAG